MKHFIRRIPLHNKEKVFPDQCWRWSGLNSLANVECEAVLIPCSMLKMKWS